MDTLARTIIPGAQPPAAGREGRLAIRGHSAPAWSWLGGVCQLLGTIIRFDNYPPGKVPPLDDASPKLDIRVFPHPRGELCLDFLLLCGRMFWCSPSGTESSRQSWEKRRSSWTQTRSAPGASANPRTR